MDGHDVMSDVTGGGHVVSDVTGSNLVIVM